MRLVTLNEKMWLSMKKVILIADYKDFLLKCLTVYTVKLYFQVVFEVQELCVMLFSEINMMILFNCS